MTLCQLATIPNDSSMASLWSTHEEPSTVPTLAMRQFCAGSTTNESRRTIMKHEMRVMFWSVTFTIILHGLIYKAIDWFWLDSLILAWVMVLALGALFVWIRHQIRGYEFKRTLDFHPPPAQHEEVTAEQRAELYEYFVICLHRGEKPGKRHWLGRSIPSLPHISISPNDWQLLARHAAYDGHLKYCGRGIGYVNLIKQSN